MKECLENLLSRLHDVRDIHTTQLGVVLLTALLIFSASVVGVGSKNGVPNQGENFGEDVSQDVTVAPNSSDTNFVSGGTDTNASSDNQLDGSGEFVTGTLEGHEERDRYTVSAEAGQVIRLVPLSTTGPLNVTLRSPDGERLIETPTKYKYSESSGVMADQSGNYTIEVSRQSESSGSAASYRVRVDTRDPDYVEPYDNTANDDRSSSLSIDGNNASLTGILTDWEEDWYAVELDGGDHLNISLTYRDDLVNLGNEMQVDVFDADGDSVGQFGEPTNQIRNRGPGQSKHDARQAVTADSAGTYYVRVSGYGSNQLGQIGGYTVYELGTNVTTATPPTTAAEPESVQAPYGGDARTLPGRIQAENFDVGGESVAYHDTDTVNQGETYRDTGVDINSQENSDNSNLGWIRDGEWVEYTVDATEGTYDVHLRVATTNPGNEVTVSLGDRTLGTTTVPNTGGWDTWQTVTIEDVRIPEDGERVLRLEFSGEDDTLFDLDWVEFTERSAGSDAGTTTEMIRDECGTIDDQQDCDEERVDSSSQLERVGTPGEVSIAPGTEVMLEVAAPDYEGQHVETEWTIEGDGSTETRRPLGPFHSWYQGEGKDYLRHTFESSGTYDVTAVVFGENGSELGTTSWTVNVESGASEPPTVDRVTPDAEEVSNPGGSRDFTFEASDSGGDLDRVVWWRTQCDVLLEETSVSGSESTVTLSHEPSDGCGLLAWVVDENGAMTTIGWTVPLQATSVTDEATTRESTSTAREVSTTTGTSFGTASEDPESTTEATTTTATTTTTTATTTTTTTTTTETTTTTTSTEERTTATDEDAGEETTYADRPSTGNPSNVSVRGTVLFGIGAALVFRRSRR